jgi:hypothetical protein
MKRNDGRKGKQVVRMMLSSVIGLAASILGVVNVRRQSLDRIYIEGTEYIVGVEPDRWREYIAYGLLVIAVLMIVWCVTDLIRIIRR